jgi:hypothetical protein
VLDEPTTLPDGTIVELIPLDPATAHRGRSRGTCTSALRDSVPTWRTASEVDARERVCGEHAIRSETDARSSSHGNSASHIRFSNDLVGSKHSRPQYISASRGLRSRCYRASRLPASITSAGIAGLRRIYLPAPHAHLYYTFGDDVVVVHALGTQNASTDRLRPRCAPARSRTLSWRAERAYASSRSTSKPSRAVTDPVARRSALPPVATARARRPNSSKRFAIVHG